MNDFEEYIRQGEPSRKEKALIWQTAIGLQDVDGLKPSEYLIKKAKENIEGKITIADVKKRVNAYYKTQANRKTETDDRTEEADKVSANIMELLSEKTFVFSPAELMSIHRRLFKGVETLHVKIGKYRNYNITKSEWILDGKTVYYAPADSIAATIDYDFKEEKNFRYKGLSKQEIVEHIVKFISGIWQIHAFGEGNTRTVAVFTIKYLRTFGFEVENDMFAKHSWYFRNALVRANFNDYEHKIYSTHKFLMKFFNNLLFSENNDLKNRYLHIKYTENDTVNEKKIPANEEKFLVNGKKFPVNGLKIMKLMESNPNITIIELSKQLNISDRAVKNNIDKLKAVDIISRVGSDKTGSWKVTSSTTI